MVSCHFTPPMASCAHRHSCQGHHTESPKLTHGVPCHRQRGSESHGSISGWFWHSYNHKACEQLVHILLGKENVHPNTPKEPVLFQGPLGSLKPKTTYQNKKHTDSISQVQVLLTETSRQLVTCSTGWVSVSNCCEHYAEAWPHPARKSVFNAAKSKGTHEGSGAPTPICPIL